MAWLKLIWLVENNVVTDRNTENIVQLLGPATRADYTIPMIFYVLSCLGFFGTESLLVSGIGLK